MVWLAAGVFVAALAASTWTIVVAARHADVPLPTHQRRVVDMPVAHVPATNAGDDVAPAPRR